MNEALQIRRIEAGDAQALLAFYHGLSAASKRTFHPLGEQTMLAVCEGIVHDNGAIPPVKLDYLAFQHMLAVGWCFVHGLRGPNPTFGLAIADAVQGKGLGSRLMDAVLDEAYALDLDRIELTVVQGNTVAQGMYERRGFLRTEAFTSEVDGLDYFRMELHLTKHTTPRQ